jgi:phosphatidate cytidylyltransferase
VTSDTALSLKQTAFASRNLTKRLISAAVIVPIVLWSLLAGPAWAFPCLTGLFCVAGSYELFTLKTQSAVERGWGVLMTAVIGLEASAVVSMSAWLNLVLLLACSSMLLSLAATRSAESFASSAAWLITGPLYVGAPLGSLIALSHCANGPAWTILAMIYAFISDTACYFGGKYFGRRALCPNISPNKTLEGAVSGLVGATIGGVIAHLAMPTQFPLLHALLLSPLAAALGQGGDLVESMIKRSAGAKDSGVLMPGHGGVLDRIDALLFTTPVVYVYVLLTH